MTSIRDYDNIDLSPCTLFELVNAYMTHRCSKWTEQCPWCYSNDLIGGCKKEIDHHGTRSNIENSWKVN